MLRRVPVKPLAISTEVLRTGKRVQTVRAELHDGDLLVASAVAMSVRTGAGIDMSPYRQPEVPLPPPPGSADGPPSFNPRADMPEGFPHVVESTGWSAVSGEAHPARPGFACWCRSCEAR